MMSDQGKKYSFHAVCASVGPVRWKTGYVYVTGRVWRIRICHLRPALLVASFLKEQGKRTGDLCVEYQPAFRSSA